MLYSKFIYEAKKLVVQQAENGLWYLEPEWQDTLYRNGLNDIDDLEDSYLAGWLELEDILKLEVEKRNTTQSVKPYIDLWLHDLITATVEPAMLQEETDYIKQVVEFMKQNHADKQPDNIIQMNLKE